MNNSFQNVRDSIVLNGFTPEIGLCFLDHFRRAGTNNEADRVHKAVRDELRVRFGEPEYPTDGANYFSLHNLTVNGVTTAEVALDILDAAAARNYE